MKKLPLEKMIERIEKGFYITRYTVGYDEVKEEMIYDYELSHDTKKGYSDGVYLTEERALEWIAVGAELLKL